MTSTNAAPAEIVAAAPRFAAGGLFLDALARQDFGRLRATLRDDAELRALVPAGLREWSGPDEICTAFANWFGNTESFELVDAVIGEIGPRLRLRWRVRMRAPRLGDDWCVVEQQVYADTDPCGRIVRMSLLCSGYCSEDH